MSKVPYSVKVQIGSWAEKTTLLFIEAVVGKSKAPELNKNSVFPALTFLIF
jgi:hypothetical protein